ncbi:MAG: Eco47II family restriction endonuclease [Candidatus Pacebacteria bacterium]|nr:Eco47II family restriction endonuclease [Candidatus Paceibacterota bacterium]
MAKTLFPYIDDKIFLKEISVVFEKIDNSLREINDDLYDNVIDPFSAVFDASGQNISLLEWIEQEKHRQLQKTLQNEIGYFHQRILGHIGDWIDPGEGGIYDSENEKEKIFAQIKNKYNTFNADSASNTYNTMAGLLDTTKKGYTGYIVIIIPKTPIRFNKKFAPSKKIKREDLLTVDGSTYYEMVTGDKDALLKLFLALPLAIIKVRKMKLKNFKVENENFLDLFYRAYGK